MKRFFPLLLLLLLLVVAAGLQVPVVRAQAEVTRTILSEYRSLIPGRANNQVRWQFKEYNLGAEGYEIEVEDQEQKVGCRAELYLNPARRLEQADCFRWVNRQEVCSAGQYDKHKPALLNATIIPGDWLNRELPFIPLEKERKTVVYEQIGTSRFATYLEIRDQLLSRAEARSRGLIRDDLQVNLPESGNLYLVEVLRDNGRGQPEVLLQQLWLTGDRFWLYEAKGGRRSWRVLGK